MQALLVYVEEYYEVYKSGRTLDQIANGIISKFNDPGGQGQSIPVGLRISLTKILYRIDSTDRNERCSRKCHMYLWKI